MASRSPLSSPRRPPGRLLIDSLARADLAVQDLRQHAANLRQSEELSALGFQREQLAQLETVLFHGAQTLSKRLAALAGSKRPPASAEPETCPAALEPISFLAAYRACCRALCAALQVAAKLADLTSTASLRDLIFRLEKQLWMIDEPDQSHGLEARRAVALFLAC